MENLELLNLVPLTLNIWIFFFWYLVFGSWNLVLGIPQKIKLSPQSIPLSVSATPQPVQYLLQDKPVSSNPVH